MQKKRAVKNIKPDQRAVRRRAPIVIAREPIVNIKTVLAPGLTQATIRRDHEKPHNFYFRVPDFGY
jgi:hypothetical protein